MHRPDARRAYRTSAAELVSASVIAAVVIAAGGLALGRTLVWIVAVPLTLALLWRVSRDGIYVDAEGVSFVGLLGSRRLRWDTIDRFDIVAIAQHPYCGAVVLRDGRTLRCLGLSGPPSRPRGRAERHRVRLQSQIDELNATLHAHAG